MLFFISSTWSDWVLLTTDLQLTSLQVKVLTTVVDTLFVHSTGILFPLLTFFTDDGMNAMEKILASSLYSVIVLDNFLFQVILYWF